MPTTPYSYVTLAQAEQELANRLYDPTMTFWSQPELLLLLSDSLHTWNAMTSYWRDDFTFPSTFNTTWYDITDPVVAPNTLRPITLFDTDIYTRLQYHLLEPIAWNPWTGVSLQFTADDLLNAVYRRQNEILSITGCTISRRLVPAVAGRIVLPDVVIDIRRIAYIPSSLFPSQVPSVLWPEDAWGEMSYNRTYIQSPAGTPFTYLQSTQPPISFDVDAPPAYAGSYDLLTIETVSGFNVAVPSTLSIPDDWSHVLVFGALADLFARESLSKDTLRANYCEQRYRMGVQLLSSASALLQMRYNNVPLQIDAVRSADLYHTSWPADVPATPQFALTSGLNKIAINPPAPPPAGTNFTATVVRNAPIPVNPGDNVQMARDDYDAMLDYAVHLAMLKAGGTEFLDTAPLFERFMSQAKLYNAKLGELGEYQSKLFNLSQLENETNPRAMPVPDIGGGE